MVQRVKLFPLSTSDMGLILTSSAFFVDFACTHWTAWMLQFLATSQKCTGWSVNWSLEVAPSVLINGRIWGTVDVNEGKIKIRDGIRVSW